MNEHRPERLRIVGRDGTEQIRWTDLIAGEQVDDGTVCADAWPDMVAQQETLPDPVRWVWSDTSRWYPPLLRTGVRVRRCLDLRLAHAILARSTRIVDATALQQAVMWDPTAPEAEPLSENVALFELDTRPVGPSPDSFAETVEELRRQHRALATAHGADHLRLLLAAESVGALIAAEMHDAGIPWDVTEHDRILRDELGPRPGRDQVPQLMAEQAAAVRAALDDPTLVVDSPPRLLRALRRAGVDVSSTSKWELEGLDHPVIAPLLRYKQMHRLLTANGWQWMEAWIREGRYRPVYVPGGVVTGRWAAAGGGALQIPRQLRSCIRADDGWTLVSADVSQLEPRALAALSGDDALATAARGQDLYSGIVAAGIVGTRQEAKVGMLGALYGGTSGDAGRVVARLRQQFPAAMRVVDGAAEVGERGGAVSTLLGRSTPPPPGSWVAQQSAAAQPGASDQEQAAARRAARDRGRFTRNFVVQGTAAEWALAWMGLLRTRLHALPQMDAVPAAASGPVFCRRAHLVLFLHDEVMVHTPAEQAHEVAAAVRAAATDAGRLLFPSSSVDFPLDLRISERSGTE